MYREKQISQELISEAKKLLGDRAIDIMDLSDYNSTTKKAPCPFHKEKDPSFSWHKASNSFKCFGCGENMDILRYYQEFRGMTFIEGIQELFKEVNIQYDFNTTSEESAKKKVAIQERKATQDKLTNEVEVYSQKLKDNSSIYNYIINDWGFKENTIKKYKLGYASDGYFRGRIIIPYLNKINHVIYATGRDATSESKLKYLKLKSNKKVNGEDLKIFDTTPIFNQHNLFNYKKYVIVVEGEKDCLTLLQEGFQAIAFSGTNIKELKQIERFKDIKTVFIIPDTENTHIGDKKAREIGKLLGIKKTVKIANLPLLSGTDKTDVNDFYNSDRGGFKDSIKSILTQANEYKHKGKPFKLTDTGNAERLVYHFGDVLRYKIETKTWLRWNGRHWEETEGTAVERLTKEVARNIYNEMNFQQNNEEQEKAYIKFQAKSESKRSRADMLDLARSEKDIPIKSNQLDKEVNLLNCKNGTINLATGEIKDHNKNDYITKYININYDKKAESPRWKQFLKEIMNDDTEIIEFLQRSIGYSLTGETREQVLFIPYGIGSNGKSLFLDTVKEILGDDYSATVQAESLATERKGKEASPDIMLLQGKRFVTSSETQKGKGLNEALVKQMTGDKVMAGRRLYSDVVQFSPQFKVWLATNHKPKITGTDDGIWRRILLIPFTQRFYDESEGKKPLQDKTLQDKLYKELEGIFNWAIQGAIKWYKDGLKIPNQVLQATEEYRKGEDILKDFINNNCYVNTDAKVLFKDMFDSFNQYCMHSNEELVTKKDFRNELESKAFKVDNGTGNKLTIYGIGIQDIVPDQGKVFNF